MRIYCPQPLAGVEIHPLFFFRFQADARVEGVFKSSLPPNYFEREVEYVGEDEAHAIVVPNNFKTLGPKESTYIRECAELGARRGIPVYIFSWGDTTDALAFDPSVHVFRLSVYRSRMAPTDIVMPTFVEDLGRGGITVREKSRTPVVSFCGQAGYQTGLQWVKYFAKVILYTVRGVFDKNAPAHIVGVFWRRRAIRACRDSQDVSTNFIVRNSYSGAWKTIGLPPERARKEFVDSILESDFVLCPKGDGNYSNRFYEALSLGRIPVIIDTDMQLPLEGRIAYDDFIVRVPMNEVGNTPHHIRSWYDRLSGQEFQRAQKRAREVFVEHLRVDSFFRSFFSST